MMNCVGMIYGIGKIYGTGMMDNFERKKKQSFGRRQVIIIIQRTDITLSADGRKISNTDLT